MSQVKCKYCHDKHDGWVRVPDGYGCVEWTHCVCMPTDLVRDCDCWENDGQPSWEQEWQDFGEVYDDEPNYL